MYRRKNACLLTDNRVPDQLEADDWFNRYLFPESFSPDFRLDVFCWYVAVCDQYVSMSVV